MFLAFTITIKTLSHNSLSPETIFQNSQSTRDHYVTVSKKTFTTTKLSQFTITSHQRLTTHKRHKPQYHSSLSPQPMSQPTINHNVTQLTSITNQNLTTHHHHHHHAPLSHNQNSQQNHFTNGFRTHHHLQNRFSGQTPISHFTFTPNHHPTTSRLQLAVFGGNLALEIALNNLQPEDTF